MSRIVFVIAADSSAAARVAQMIRGGEITDLYSDAQAAWASLDRYPVGTVTYRVYEVPPPCPQSLVTLPMAIARCVVMAASVLLFAHGMGALSMIGGA
jgi:hypothetical protein